MAGIRSPGRDSKKGAARAQFSPQNLCSSVSICGFLLLTILLGCGALACLGQIEPKQLGGVLGEELVSPSVSAYQVRHYLVNLVAPPPSPTTADQWTQEAKRLREHWLDDVVYHGWPREVVEASARFEETGVIETGSGRNGEAESISYVFDFGNGLSANGVLVRLRGSPENAPVTLVLNDQGKKESGAAVAARVSKGDQVLALDLAFFGNAWRDVPVPEYAQIIDGLGERPLGIIVGQLLEITRWMRVRAGGAPARMDSTGLRQQVAVLAAAALEPSLFSEITIRDGKKSLAC